MPRGSTVKCPNCSERITIPSWRHGWWGKEFKCPMCAATIGYPKRLGRIFIVSQLLFLLWALAIYPVCYLLNINPRDAVSFNANSIITSVMFLADMVFFFTVLAVMAARWRLRVVHVAPSCANCGAIVSIENALFCPRCGASVSIGAGGRVAPIEQTAPIDGFVGACTVCKKQLRASDDTSWCPHCGSPAHRIHLLEYLHVHDLCPACGKHLDEKELKKQLSLQLGHRQG